MYMLWTYFLKVYPKQETQFSKGVGDPKTFCQYVGPYMYALADLESVVVRVVNSFVDGKF